MQYRFLNSFSRCYHYFILTFHFELGQKMFLTTVIGSKQLRTRLTLTEFNLLDLVMGSWDTRLISAQLNFQKLKILLFQWFCAELVMDLIWKLFCNTESTQMTFSIFILVMELLKKKYSTESFLISFQILPLFSHLTIILQGDLKFNLKWRKISN